MSNPLLAEFTTPYQVVPFHLIKESHYLEGIEQALEEAKNEINLIIENQEPPTFSNTIEALESAGEKLGRNSSILFNLNSAETSDEIQKIAQEVSPKLSAFNSEVKQNEKLFLRVKSVFEKRENLDLNVEERKLLQEKVKV